MASSSHDMESSSYGNLSRNSSMSTNSIFLSRTDSKTSVVDSGVSSLSSLPGEGMDKKEAATEHGYDADKIAQLEGDILQLQSQLASVDVNAERLLVSVETLIRMSQ